MSIVDLLSIKNQCIINGFSCGIFTPDHIDNINSYLISYYCISVNLHSHKLILVVKLRPELQLVSCKTKLSPELELENVYSASFWYTKPDTEFRCMLSQYYSIPKRNSTLKC